MINKQEIRKVLGGIILTILWICCFLFIKSTLIIDWGGGITTNFKFFVIIVVLLIMFLYNLLYPSHIETTKLSWTASATITWLSLIIFYPFRDPANTAAGTVGFFTLVGGLAICVLWVRFLSDEIVA